MALLVLVAASFVLVAPGAPAGSTSASPRIAISLSRDAFSPNGDGRSDTVRVVFRLPASALVTVLVRRPNGRVVARHLVGRQPRGRGSWVLDGRTARGKVLRDGYYDVQVVARSGGRRWHSVARQVVLDTAIDVDVVRRDWPAVHPRTPGIVDTVVLEHLASFYEDIDEGRFSIYAPDGDRLASWGKDEQTDTCAVIDLETYCGTSVEWDGRLDGRPLPRGTYTAEFAARDPAGNVARRRLAVRVSDEPLVARSASVLVAAAEAVPPPAPYTGCNGCGEEIGSQCGTVTAPGRFGPGSLRYASRDTCDTSMTPIGKPQAAREHAAPMLPAAAYGPRSVTFSGGPSVPGAGDVAHLLLDGVDTTRTGDGEATSQQVMPAWPGRTSPWVGWRFETRGVDSYDVAWFRVDYTYYATP